ncbi:hypothetical protein H4J59_02500 [Colwellia sp. MB02u-10]|uniref:hypothetical protein n=1 Tax=Colwellia sp. MB02u-10 TaxID=2759828 RepID=UPI0015F5794C|nr:hypothetical protein [Colwellia sp. MB02u-10]MBA6339873.1 hypothetical protein [Colwellia sp. MB02u-10]
MRFSSKLSTTIIILLSTLLLACSDGADNGEPSIPTPVPTTPVSTTQTLSGGAVKGPLANAIVTVYAFDSAQAGFKGAVIASGTTDASAAITGLALPTPLTPPYIMEFTSTAGITIDITTGVFPFINTLSSVITQGLLDSGEPVYATPLTTLALSVAINQSTNEATAAEFLVTLLAAAEQVAKTFGFGMPQRVDIFVTPPLVNNASDTLEALSDTLAYRTAIEAFAAVTFEMEQDVSTTSDVSDIITELAKDLSDGVIDARVNGVSSEVYNTATLTQLSQDPTGLTIPNTTLTVAEVASMLVDETNITGTTTSTAELSNGAITVTIEPVTSIIARWGEFNWNDGSTWQ